MENLNKGYITSEDQRTQSSGPIWSRMDKSLFLVKKDQAIGLLEVIKLVGEGVEIIFL